MSGGILIDEAAPSFVEHHDGSVCIIFYVEDQPDTRQAARGIIDTFAESGVETPMLVVVNYQTATVLPIPLSILGLQRVPE